MTTRKPRTIRSKKPAPDEKTTAVDILRPAVLDLVAVMDRVKDMAEDSLGLPVLLDLLDAIGKSSTRLATLLKTEQQLADGSQDSKEFDEAVAELFGHRAIFQDEGYDGSQGKDQSQPS